MKLYKSIVKLIGTTYNFYFKRYWDLILHMYGDVTNTKLEIILF